jgi:broad specificity phosphatase PhoE
MKRVLMVALTMCAMMVPMVAEAQMVIVVRHAERADGGAGTGSSMAGSTDPELSETGKARAQKLAAMLGDAGVVAIYTTQYKRTKATATPLGDKIGVSYEAVPSGDMAGLIAKIKSHKSGAVLVVAHSNTVPVIVKALGGPDVTVGDAEYDSLFFVAANGTTTRIKFKP